MPTCKHCQTDKPLEAFYKKGRGRSGWCKECHKAWSAQQQKEDYFNEHRRKQGVPKRGQKLSGEAFSVNQWCRATRHMINARANRSHVACDITHEWLLAKVTQFAANNYVTWEKRSAFRPSVDRIVASRGYTQDNCRIVWLIENYARNVFSDEDLIEFCKRKLGLL